MAEAPWAPQGGTVVIKEVSPVNIGDIQSVTSHGNEAVSDAKERIVVEHSPGRVVLKPYGNKKSGMVHVPIHHPANLLNGTWYLHNIAIRSQNQNATVSVVTLYYDEKRVVSTNNQQDDDFYITFNEKQATDYQYIPPKGICVTLKVSFEEDDGSVIGSVNLYSVTAVFGTTSKGRSIISLI